MAALDGDDLMPLGQEEVSQVRAKETGAAILQLCNGQRSVAQIAGVLQERYGSDVTADVITYLSGLAERELIRDA